MSGEVFRPFQCRTKFQNITPDDALFDPSVMIVAALLGGAGRDVTFSWSNYAQLLISNRLQYVLGKQKNLSSFRAFCVNETTESKNTGKTSYGFHSRGLGIMRSPPGVRVRVKKCEILHPQKFISP